MDSDTFGGVTVGRKINIHIFACTKICKTCLPLSTIAFDVIVGSLVGFGSIVCPFIHHTQINYTL